MADPDRNAALAEFVSLLDVAESYPGLPSNFVDRPTLTGALTDLMTRDFDAILLDGPEDGGKTTALAQFASRFQKQAICLFLRPVTEFTYDPVRVRYDLCSQLSWHLFGRPSQPDDRADGGALRYRFHRLERKAIQEKRLFYFIVDGLADIPQEAASVRQTIVATMLPIGVPSFKFLVSGSLETTGLDRLPKVKSRTQLITTFTTDEALALFGDLLTRDQAEEINRSCNGIPGRLASVRRLIAAGANAQQLIDGLAGDAPEIFAIEWDRLDLEDPTLASILAIAAHTPELACISTLQELIHTDQSTIRGVISRIPFLHIESQGDRVRFASESFRKYAALRLGGVERFSLERAMEHLRTRSSPEEAFRVLPEYLERSGDIRSLISYFNSRNIGMALATSRSIAMVSERLRRATKLALAHGMTDAASQYILQRAALRGVLGRRARRAQVEAALVTHGETNAIALASATYSDEERLHLLALIVRRQRADGLRPEPQTVAEISRLASRINWNELQDEALATATELLPAVPDIGISILERSQGREDNPNALDSAIASAFFRAALRRDAGTYRRELLEYAYDKSQSTEVKKLYFATGLSPAETATQLAGDLERVSNTSEKVFLLRQWLETRSHRDDASGVALLLLDVMLNDTRYAPNAGGFAAAVSVAANGSGEVDDRRRIIQVVEAQLQPIKMHSPIIDYVRLLGELTLARYAIHDDDHIALLVEEAEDLRTISDPSSRAACFAWILRMFARLERHHVDDSWGLRLYARRQLESAVAVILETCAEQKEAMRGIIKPLAGHELTLVEALISHVNTQLRRDELYEELIDKTLEDKSGALSAADRLACVPGLRSRIVDPFTRRRTAYRVIKWAAEGLSSRELPSDVVQMLMQLAVDIEDADARLTALANLYCGMPAADQSGEAGCNLLREIDEAWRKATFKDRIDCSFALASQLHGCNPMIAAGYYDEGTRMAATPQGLIASVSPVIRRLITLVARACAAMERASVATVEDWDKLWALVGKMPTKGAQSLIAAFAALKLAKKKPDTAASIVSERLKPLLREYMGDMEDNPTEMEFILWHCAPALWIQHSGSVEEFIGKLEVDAQDEAYGSILTFLLDGRIPGDAWEETSRKAGRITYEVATDVVTVLGRIRGDSVFADGCETFLAYLRDRQADVKLNRNQRAELLRVVAQSAQEKLPEPKHGIKHDGYVILVEASLMAAEGERGCHEWEKLVVRAQGIPNVSDSVFVLGSLVDVIPAKCDALRMRAFETAERGLSSLGLLEDRLDRCEHLVKASRDHYPGRCKELLRVALEEAIERDNPSIERRRRKFLDLLYRVDPEAASAVASATDNDPERRGTRQGLLEHLEDIKVGQSIRAPDTHSEVDVPVARLAKVCRRELGWLNASGVCTRSALQNFTLLESCQEGTIESTYDIASFAIEAMSARYETTHQASEYLRPLFIAMTEACEMALIAIQATQPEDMRAGQKSSGDTSAAAIYIGVGSREEARDVIRKWVVQSESSYVKICDPYFTPDDMELLEVFGELLPQADITILTSLKAASRTSTHSINEQYELAWRRLRDESKPKYCRIIIAGIPRNRLFSIHNRWIILDDLGVDLGTSSGAVGGDRSHVITRLDPLTSKKCEADVDEYLLMERRFWMEERVSYQVLSLEK